MFTYFRTVQTSQIQLNIVKCFARIEKQIIVFIIINVYSNRLLLKIVQSICLSCDVSVYFWLTFVGISPELSENNKLCRDFDKNHQDILETLRTFRNDRWNYSVSPQRFCRNSKSRRIQTYPFTHPFLFLSGICARHQTGVWAVLCPDLIRNPFTHPDLIRNRYQFPRNLHLASRPSFS